MLASEPPKKLTPAPAKVILDVEANTSGRFWLPAAAASPSTSICRTESWVRVCTAYALSQNSRKSGAAVRICTSRRTFSHEKVTPVGLENTGTHHMPLMAGSAATSSSIRSTSGPSSRIGTLIISTPRLSVIAKCRS